MEENVPHWINQQPYFSTKVYGSIKNVAEFKVDRHFVYIQARKDPDQTWFALPFISIDEAIYAILDTWPWEWRRPDAVGCDEATIQKQKAKAKNAAQQKLNEQHTAKFKRPERWHRLWQARHQ